MVRGFALKEMIDFVERKKGINGIQILHREVNRKNLIIPELRNINTAAEFSTGYFERMLNASLISLNGNNKIIHEFGYVYGKHNGIGITKHLLRLGSAKRIFYSIVSAIKKNLPLFSIKHESLSEHTYRLTVGNINSTEQRLFVSGYIDAILEGVGRKIYKKESDLAHEKVIILRFLD